MTSCPCGLPLTYEQCCGQYIEALASPATPEALMRSRYSAFVLGNISYLSNTMKGKAFEQFDFANLAQWLAQVKWQNLTVLKTKMKTSLLGYVTFQAKYIENGTVKIIYEKSEFKKIAGKWYYVDGKHLKLH